MKTRHALVTSALTALGASACCVLPLVLVALGLGLGGAWLSTLAALEPLRPLLVVVTLSLLGLAGWRLYHTPPSCEQAEACVAEEVRGRQRMMFWLVSAAIVALLSFPQYAPLFY